MARRLNSNTAVYRAAFCCALLSASFGPPPAAAQPRIHTPHGSATEIASGLGMIRDLAVAPDGKLLAAVRSSDGRRGELLSISAAGEQAVLASGFPRIEAAAAVGGRIVFSESAVRSREEMLDERFERFEPVFTRDYGYRTGRILAVNGKEPEVLMGGFTLPDSLAAHGSALAVYDRRSTPFAMPSPGGVRIDFPSLEPHVLFPQIFDSLIDEFTDLAADSEGYLFGVGVYRGAANVYLLASLSRAEPLFGGSAPGGSAARIAFDSRGALLLFDPASGKLYLAGGDEQYAALLASGLGRGAPGGLAVQGGVIYAASAGAIHAIALDPEHYQGTAESLGLEALRTASLPVPLSQRLRRYKEMGGLLAPVQPAEQPAELCLSYNPELRSWGPEGTPQQWAPSTSCPDGYAYISMWEATGPRRDGAFVPALGNCCPLPPGVLTGTHAFVEKSCPDGYVATGGRPAKQRGSIKECYEFVSSLSLWERFTQRSYRRDACSVYWGSVPQLMRCTKIDASRFKLGELKPSYAYGWDRSFRTLFDKRTSRGAIPPALRYAAGRRSRTKWEKSGCIGYPWGSLYVEKQSKYCRGLLTRQLLYRGAPGDPPAGTPVNLYPDCKAVDDPLSPRARCLR